MIDEISLTILEILQDKARVPNAEVARQVGMAPSAVLERIRKLESQGIIEGYEVRLNPRHFGGRQAVFLRVSAEESAGGQPVGEALAALPQVQEVHQVAGEDGYLVKLRVADAEEFGRLLRDQIRTIPGVRAVRSSLVLSTLKETFRIPLDSPDPSIPPAD
jgi:Lrp/AsnC family transcriptional regulator, leucine-responsive regulatory protein